MWATPLGERTLVGAEAELIGDTVAYMTDLLHQEANGLVDEWPCGVALYDELSWQQRLALLARVANALFRPDVPAPNLSAVNEATVGAIFAHIRQRLEIELDLAADDQGSDLDATNWRRRIAACQEPPECEDGFYVSESCTDMNEWDVLLECLADQILWDGDWDMPDLFLDVEPDLSRARHSELGIESDYFITPAPDPRESELASIFSDLRRLTEHR